MLLKTERLYIRYINRDDWKSLQEIWKNFASSKYAQYDVWHNTDAADVRKRAVRWEEGNRGEDHLFFAVCLKDTMIGYISFNRRGDGYEVGYCFHSAYQGKGYAREGLLALVNYFQEIGISGLTAGTALKNLPSVKLLRAVGFRQTGTERVSFYKYRAGRDIVFDGGIYEWMPEKTPEGNVGG